MRVIRCFYVISASQRRTISPTEYRISAGSQWPGPRLSGGPRVWAGRPVHGAPAHGGTTDRDNVLSFPGVPSTSASDYNEYIRCVF